MRTFLARMRQGPGLVYLPKFLSIATQQQIIGSLPSRLCFLVVSAYSFEQLLVRILLVLLFRFSHFFGLQTIPTNINRSAL